MSQVLIIHSDARFTRRIRNEAGTLAIVSSSMRQALQVISDPETPLAGIYLNPKDADYSAFKFLETALLNRPATPVFIFDADSTSEPGSAPSYLNDFNIKAVFKGNESFETLLSPLKLKFDPEAQGRLIKRPAPASPHKGYVAIPVMDLAPLPVFPFDLFIEDESKTLCLIGVMNNRIEPEYLATLALTTAWVYVHEQSIIEIRDLIRSAQSGYMDLGYLPDAWKTAETLYRAGLVLKEFGKSAPNDSHAEQASLLLGDLFQLVSRLGSASKMRDLVEMARSCDRTLHCTTLAILMSRILRYEHESIVEILGLASFFQDVALLQSPFGNLAELSRDQLAPEARAYFDHHPILSANLVSKGTHLPEVTLQVIRQHHERPDRTGFPNRIGGAQLHPMAEILSLINTYFDLGSEFRAQRDEVLSHYSEKVARAFSTLIDRLDSQ
jgi:hypothetical protein